MTRHRPLRAAILGVAGLVTFAACTASAPRAPSPGAEPSWAAVRATRQRVVLIGIDGFRADYVDRPHAVNLRRLAARGVRAERLIPAFPSKTFPNHYTIVTGLTPEHHGIVANVMKDPALGTFRTSDTLAIWEPRWWGGEPIWVTAERQGRRAATYFWPGSEAEIGGVRPTWWQRYEHARPRAARVRQVIDWLAMPADSAPALITLYFADTDDAGHAEGPFADTTNTAIANADSAVGAIMDAIDRLGLREVVNIIVVADHGMTASRGERLILIDDYVPRASVDVIDWTPVASIVPADGDVERVYRALKDKHPHLQVYRKGEVPERLHFNDHPRITPIVAIADEGWTLTDRASLARRGRADYDGGQHGYDPALPSMGAVFIAAGPGIAVDRRVPGFRNVHVYPLMAHLLGLRAAPSDGALDSVRAILR